MRKVLAMVLAGGEGKRLYPLTKERSKPAVYFGGRYRLVDFVLSNLVNSGFTQIKVITQYKATSLVRHLTRAWPLASAVLDQYVEVAPAAMNRGPTWFRGTADANGHARVRCLTSDVALYWVITLIWVNPLFTRFDSTKSTSR